MFTPLDIHIDCRSNGFQWNIKEVGRRKGEISFEYQAPKRTQKPEPWEKARIIFEESLQEATAKNGDSVMDNPIKIVHVGRNFVTLIFGKPINNHTMHMKKFIILFWFIISQITLAEVRTWTTVDGGKSIEAEFISTGNGEVTIKRKSDQRLFTLPLSKLSEADQAWVKTQQAEKSTPAEVKEPDPTLVKLITGEWERHEAHGMKFRIFGDRKIRRSKKETYPMVIYLHGRGNDVMTPEEPGNANTFTNESKNPCLVLAPQSLGEGGWKGSNADMVFKIIDDMLATFPIDQKRIYITGYSMGAFGTFEFLAMKPELFAAGVTVAGGASPQNAQKLKDIPIWAFHGDADEAVKVESSRNIVEAIKKLNGKIKYTEIPGGDHGIANQVYRDEEMHKWLFEQKRAD